MVQGKFLLFGSYTGGVKHNTKLKCDENNGIQIWNLRILLI